MSNNIELIFQNKKLAAFMVFSCCVIICFFYLLLFGTDHSGGGTEHYGDRLLQIEFEKDMSLKLLETDLNIAAIDWEMALDENEMTKNNQIEITKFDARNIHAIMMRSLQFPMSTPVTVDQFIETLLKTEKLKTQMVKDAFQYQVESNQVILDYETNYACLASINNDVEGWIQQSKEKRKRVQMDLLTIVEAAEASAKKSKESFWQFITYLY